jgi:uncharacterized protein YgiM (DUF1202 family)
MLPNEIHMKIPLVKENKMKRINLWATLALLLITTLSHAEEKTVYVNVPSMNIRAEAGTQYDVVKSVPSGYSLKILDEQDNWYKNNWNPKLKIKPMP